MEDVIINSPEPIITEKKSLNKICHCLKCNGKEISQAAFYRHKKNNQFATKEPTGELTSSLSPPPPEGSPLSTLDDLLPEGLKGMLSEPESPEQIRINKKKAEEATEASKVPGVALEGLGDTIGGVIKYIDTLPMKMPDGGSLSVNGMLQNNPENLKQRSDAIKGLTDSFDKYCKIKGITTNNIPVEGVVIIAAIPVFIPFIQLLGIKKQVKAAMNKKQPIRPPPQPEQPQPDKLQLQEDPEEAAGDLEQPVIVRGK